MSLHATIEETTLAPHNLQDQVQISTFRESRLYHFTPLLKKTALAPITYRNRFKIIALLTYKAISGLALSYKMYLTSIKTGADYSLRSGDELLLNFPLRKSYSTLGDRSLSMAAPLVWNSVPFL